jgi:hypothetical protein
VQIIAKKENLTLRQTYTILYRLFWSTAFLGIIEPLAAIIISKIYHKEPINKLQFIGSLWIVASFLLTIFK